MGNANTNESYRFPNWIIIGAAKAATTWACRELARYESVYVHPKEIHYFSNKYKQKSNRWYKNHFEKKHGKTVYCENSNTYMYQKKVPERMGKTIPQVERIIAILRDPVERAYSGYCMQLRKGNVSGNIKRHLDPEEESLFLTQGKYYEHLRRYFDYFGESKMKILLYEDLKKSEHKFIRDLTSGANIGKKSNKNIVNKKVNKRKRKTIPKKVKKLAKHWKLDKILQWLPVDNSRIRKLVQVKSMKYPALDRHLKVKIRKYYESDIKKLSALIGRDLREWKN
jgi:hypothetical protein